MRPTNNALHNIHLEKKSLENTAVLQQATHEDLFENDNDEISEINEVNQVTWQTKDGFTTTRDTKDNYHLTGDTKENILSTREQVPVSRETKEYSVPTRETKDDVSTDRERRETYKPNRIYEIQNLQRSFELSQNLLSQQLLVMNEPRTT